METRTQNGEHDGFPWSVSVTKSEYGTYTAEAQISCQMHNVLLCFPDNSGEKKGIPKLPCFTGSYLTENPFRWIVGFIEGFINGRNELVMTLLAEGKTEELNKIINNEAQKMKPTTNPTTEQIEQMKAEINSMIDRFGAAGIAHLAKVVDGEDTKTTIGAVRQWVNRGRISAKMAHKLCELDAVKSAGFTREKLRPDVKSWVEMDYPIEQA